MELTTENEKRLIEQAKKDPSAFEPLYDFYFDKIFVFVLRRVGNREITSDIVSQVFLKALTNIRGYHFQGFRLSAWLYKIALNEVRFHYRKSSRNKEFYVDNDVIQNVEEQIEESFDEDLIEMISEVLKTLGEDAVHLIELRFFEQKSFKEIAFILGIEEGAAKVRTYRLLDKLKLKVNARL